MNSKDLLKISKNSSKPQSREIRVFRDDGEPAQNKSYCSSPMPLMEPLPTTKEVDSGSLLKIKNLSIAFDTLQVTDKISFDILSGEIFTLMGESGCGKSVTAMAIPRLLPFPSGRIANGEILFEGKNLVNFSPKEMSKIRGRRIGCIFQEPMQSLNPVISVGAQLLETRQPLDRIKSLLTSAGFSDTNRILKSYPHELSGGMLQRIIICMALAPKPSLLIADEPTTALDASIQNAVMDTMQKLCAQEKTALLLITHNAALAAKYSDKAAVMYAGRIAEIGTAKEVLETPIHPYTKALLNVVPTKGKKLADLKPIKGSVPNPKDFDEGCRFRFRCEQAKKECAEYNQNQPSNTLTPSATRFAFCLASSTDSPRASATPSLL